MSDINLATEIAEIIADFRLGEIKPRTPLNVMRFVDDIQSICDSWMNSIERKYFMEGLRDSLNRHYWSATRISETVERFDHTFFSDIGKSSCAVLDMQGENSSQSFITSCFDLRDFQSYDYVPEGFDVLLYLDDVVCTGSTLGKNLKIIGDQISALSIRPSKLIVWHILGFLIEANAILEKATSRLSSLGVEVSFHWVDQHRRRDVDGHCAEVMIPSKDLASLPQVKRYLASSTSLKKISNSNALWRDPQESFHDRMFASSESRDVVEHAFLDVGVWLRSKSPYWDQLLRPFGYVGRTSKPSLGFGTMFITCFNSSNTIPVTLWWGDPKATNSALSKWEPLLPRRPQ